MRPVVVKDSEVLLFIQNGKVFVPEGRPRDYIWNDFSNATDEEKAYLLYCLAANQWLDF